MNGFRDLCEDESDCGVYDYANNNCETSADVPSHTSGSVSDCSVLDGYKDACDALAATAGNGPNNRGCSFNKSDNGCDETPAYTNDCTVFNNFEDACGDEADC